jgi:putative endonuclease
VTPARKTGAATARHEPAAGPTGEALAAAFLQRLGYRVECRNLRTVHGEIDLLVRNGRTWVAGEVKASAVHPAPERTAAPAQLRRVARALRALAPGLRPRPRRLRVDLVAVRLSGGGHGSGPDDVRHFQDVCAPGPDPL